MLREGQVRIPSGCAVSGIFAKDGGVSAENLLSNPFPLCTTGTTAWGAAKLWDLSHEEHYAFHVFYDSQAAKRACEKLLMIISMVNLSKIPVGKTPKNYRRASDLAVLCQSLPTKLKDSQLDEREYTARCVMRINTRIEGAYVFSSGKTWACSNGRLPSGGMWGLLPPAGGAAPGYCWTATGGTLPPGWWGAYLSLCWTIQWCIMARSAL